MSSFLTDNYDDGGVEIPLLVKPPPMSPSLVLNQAMARTTPSSSRKMNRITFSPSDVSRSISGSSDDGSDRYCADLACMEFFRSPPATATTRSSSSNKKRPLSAPTALQRRMSLPSLQNQMQSIIRLQAWWRRILAMQHYQTMRVCRQLLQQLQLQSTGSAYQELQQAVAALHVKTQQQLQQQDQRSITGTSHSPNQPSRDTLTAFHSSSLVGEEKKDDRFIQTKLSEDSSLLYGLGDDTSYISEDPLLLAHASQRLQQQQQQPDTNADNNNISSHLRQNRKPTKEMMALDTIYALQLALDNTDPDSQLYFSRQELMSPHRDVIARQQQQQKQVSPQQSSQGDSQGEEDIFHSPLPDVSNILESATSESFDDCHSDENESVHDISLAMDDRNVSTSSAYNVLRFFGFVQDKVIEEEVFHTENVYHDIMDSEGQDVIKELDELFAVAEEEDQVSVVHELQSPTAALDPSFYQSLDDTSFFHSLNETRVATPLKMYSQNEARAAKVIQDWWRQLVLRRKWETLRVCSTILRTVQYASHATPISSYSYPPQPTVENSYPATFYPELQHAIQWLKAKTHRQVSVRNYLKQSLQKEVACQKIQKWFRTCSRRRNLELQRRQQLEAEYHENSLFLAALAIQDWWRGVDLKRHAKQRRVFLRQRLERRDSLRKIEEAKRDEHRRRERAAKVLQGWWRVCQMQQIMTDIERISERGRSSSSLLLEEALADDVSSIASSASDGGDAEIQKWALERQRLAEQRYMTLVNSCQIIQQTWRAGMRRQVARKRRKMAIDAICTIQRKYLAYSRRRDARRHMMVVIASILRIQRTWSAYCSRRNARQWRKGIFLGLARLQARARAQFVRERQQERKMASTLIQSHWRRFKTTRELQKGELAVIALQTHCRRRAGHRKASRQRDGRRVLVLLQAHARRRTVQHQVAKHRATMRGVIKFQSHFRRRQFLLVHLLLRHRQERSRLLHQIAGELLWVNHGATIIQSGLRRRLARRRYNNIREAATFIQTLWRGATCLRSYKIQKKYLVLLQACVRRHSAARKVQQLKWANHVRCIVRLQAHFRRRKCLLVYTLLQHRRKYQPQLLQQVQAQLVWANQCATVIQSYSRTYVARRSFKKHQRATILLQTFWRKLSLSQLYKVQKQRVLQLQAWGRMCAAVFELQHLQKQHMATIMIQSSIRRFLLQHQWKRFITCAVTIQTNVRGWIVFGEYQRKQGATVSLQACWRSVRETRLFKMKQACAIKLQSFARKHAAVKQYETLRWKHQVRCIIRLQAHFRRRQCLLGSILLQHRRMLQPKLFHRTQGHLLWHINSATLVQSAFRRFLARGHYKKAQRATILIQAFWRGKLLCQAYKWQLHCVVKLQSWARRCAAVLELQQVQEEYRASVVIQATFRGYLIHRQYQHQVASAVGIQSAFRGWILQKQYKSQWGSVIVIQAFWRRWTAQKAYRLQLQCTILLQSCVRRHAAAKQYETLRWKHHVRCIVRLQAHYRRRQCLLGSILLQHRRMLQAKLFHRTQGHLLWHINSATLVQSAFRRFLARGHYMKAQRATILIQAFWRGKLLCQAYKWQLHCVVKLQSWARRCAAVLELQQVQEEYRASVVIQATFRGYLIHRQYQHQVASAVGIQSAFRSWILQKHYKSQWASMIVIQSFWRRARAQQAYKLQRWSLLRLQCCARRHNAIASVKELRKKHKAAVQIQSNLRGCLGRRQLVQWNHSAVSIQSVWRVAWAKTQYSRQLAACIVLQSAIRGLLAQLQLIRLVQARREVAEAERRFHVACAATTLQTTWRGCSSRAMLTKSRVLASMIQAAWRGHTTRMNYWKMRSSCVVLQSCSRREIALHRFKERRIVVQRNAAARVQASVRLLFQLRRYKKHIASALLLQSWMRSCGTRLQYNKQRRSIVILQSWERRIRSVSALKSLKSERERHVRHEKAACQLQRMFRGGSARRQIRIRRTAAALVQRYYRRWVAKFAFEKKLGSCVKIQSLARGYLTVAMCRRLQMESLEQTQCNKAVVGVQRLYRGYSVRLENWQRTSSAIRLQSVWRSFILSSRFKTMRRSVVVLQARSRRKECHERFRLKRSSAIALQSFWRQRMAMILFQMHCRSFARLQAITRGSIVRQQYSIMTRSALQLQAFCRKKRARDLYLRKRKAATLMQRCFQQYRCRRHKTEVEKLSVRVQAYWRGSQARESFVRHVCASVKIQAFCRRILVLKSHRLKSEAAHSIQRGWRKKQLLAAVHGKEDAARLLQTTVQLYLCRQRFKRVRNSMCSIQKLARGVLTRQLYTETRIAAMMIQSLVRCHLESKRFSLSRYAALLLQRQWRRWIHRNVFRKIRTGCIKLQSVERMVLAQKEFHAFVSTAVLIQTAIRRSLASRRYREVRSSVLMIQAIARCHVAVTQFLRAKSSASRLQAMFRKSLAVSRFREYSTSANKLQTFWRVYAAKSVLATAITSVTVIQAHYRGFRSRSQLEMLSRRASNIQRAWRSRRELIDAAVIIQRWWQQRRIPSITDGQEGRNRHSIVLCQRNVRRSIARRKYLGLRKSILRIQSYARMVVPRARFKHLQRGAIVLQSLQRKRASRRLFPQSRAAAVSIQCFWRSKMNRVRYSRMNVAARHVQRLWRGLQSQRSYCLARIRIVTLQSLVRGWLVRLNRQSLLAVDRGSETQSSLTMNQAHAAVVMQAGWRRFQAGQTFSFARSQTLTIQAVFRGHRAKKKYISLLQNTRRIQRLWRGHLARGVTNERRKLHDEKQQSAVVLIQANGRAIVARRKFVKLRGLVESEILSRKNIGVLKVQSVSRGFLTRQILFKQNTCALKIQMFFRGFLARQILLKNKMASLKIQSVFRGRVARIILSTKKISALMIQSVFRGFLARRHLCCSIYAATMMQSWWRDVLRRKSRLASRFHVTVLQSHYRCRIARRHYQCMKVSATTIQATIRMSRARFYFLGARNGVVHIQRLARGMLDRRSYEQVRIAVVLMQKAYRSRKSNLAFVQQRSALLAIHRCERNWIGLGRRKRLRNAAAAQIQKRWRSWTYLRARVFVKRKAIIVQSAIRAFLARRAADQRRKAVASIQACLRRYSLKRRQACREASASVIIQKAWSEWAKRRIRSATAIQKPVRIFLGRSLVRRNVIAAIVVQSAFRMWSQQRRLSASRQAALMIQRVTKGFSVRNRRRLVQGSIVLLESSIRGWLLRVKLRHEASAAVVVQSTWRTHSHRVRYQNIQRALVVLLRFGRHILLRNELHDQSSTDGRLHLENQILPRRIQSMFRGHRIRRDLRRRQVAAVALQCWWRACMEMKRKHQKEALFALVRLQNLWRSYDARRAYYYVIICALRIQSQVRGYMVRREGQLLVGKKAARLIQANVRRWLARNQVLCQFRCAMVLQSLVRRSSAIALADAMQKSIIKIQAFARRYLAACLTESRKRSLVIIQTWARCCLARALAYSRRKSATKIQSLAKRYSAVALADSRRRRIIQIQSWIRGLLAVEGAMTRQQAVATIQRNLKSWIVRLKLRLHIKKILVTARALVLFQSLARRQLVLKEIAVKQRSAIAIQSAWRGFDARSLVMGMIANDACILIQSWIRGYLAQRNGVLKKTKTIVPIQNMVRRYLAILLAEARKESVVAIQTWARKCLAVALADSRRKSVIQIQSLARKSLAVEAAMSRQQAVAIIQCNLKSMFVRLKLKLGLARVRATARAFVLFQSLARRHLVLKEIAVKQRSAIAIQSAWRGFDARSLVMGMIANDACILIQSWIRGYLVQRNGALKHSKLASLRIQKAVRCFFAKGLFLAMREAAIRIQCLARVLSAKAKVNTRRVAIATIHRNMCVMVTKLRLERGLSMLRARRESVKLIQSKFRQYLVSNEDILANRLQAVVTIQRVWRGFVGRAIFSLLQDEAKVLQSMVRMGMARKRFLRRRHAVGVIQKFVRSRLAIRELCRLAMHDRMRPLLADLSSHISRKEYEKASNAAEKEVRLLLGGDLPTLNSAGICLRRLVTHVAQFRFLLETEKEEQSAAFETFDHVKDHCALCS